MHVFGPEENSFRELGDHETRNLASYLSWNHDIASPICEGTMNSRGGSRLYFDTLPKVKPRSKAHCHSGKLPLSVHGA